MTNELKHDAVYDLLCSYKDEPEITKQLQEFGQMMVAESQERTGQLDGKATNIVGYSGVILAFLVAWIADWSSGMNFFGRIFVGISSAIAIYALWKAFIALRTRKWRWFSDAEWFAHEVLTDKEHLRKYHVLMMHAVRSNNAAINRDKADALIKAQGGLIFATGFLALALIFTLMPLLC